MAVCLEFVGDPQLQPDTETLDVVMESVRSRLPEWVAVEGNRFYEAEDRKHLTVESVSRALEIALEELDCQGSDCFSVDDFEVKTD